MKIVKYILAFGVLAISLACKKDKKEDVVNPPNPNANELITSFKIVFVDANGVLPNVEARFVDIDGPGGNPPSIFDTIRLSPNTTYNASITLLNESVIPTQDITVEVQQEGVDHLFCFTVSAGLNATVTKTDLDANNLPVGIQNQWVTTATSTGTSIIVLKHQPGIKTGDCALGETDLELSFQTEIQ